MIISASRRTDIPALYAQWFLNRLREGFVYIPNPRNPGRIGRAALSPEHVDCIVFWTKNPIPLLNKLDQLDGMGYRYYIQFTLTPYGDTVERFLPPKAELVRAFIQLSERIGAARTVWRYDPVLVDGAHTLAWHIEQFAHMCAKLGAYTRRCVLSFIDSSLGGRFRVLMREEMEAVAGEFSKIAKRHGIKLYTCAEEIDLSRFGITHGACIDQSLIEQLTGYRIKAKNDPNQRSACRCIESVDVGAYDTCTQGCAYCYATSSAHTAGRRHAAHDPKAPMITGYPRGDELITDRTTPSGRIGHMQLSWWDTGPVEGGQQ